MCISYRDPPDSLMKIVLSHLIVGSYSALGLLEFTIAANSVKASEEFRWIEGSGTPIESKTLWGVYSQVASLNLLLVCSVLG